MITLPDKKVAFVHCDTVVRVTLLYPEAPKHVYAMAKRERISVCQRYENLYSQAQWLTNVYNRVRVAKQRDAQVVRTYIASIMKSQNGSSRAHTILS